MKRISHALLALMFVAAAFARGADDKPKETPYYPLKLGTTWSYKAGDVTITSKVAKWEEMADQQCARIEASAGGKLAAVEHVAVKEDGVYRFAYGGVKADPPLMFLKLPPVKGKTWDAGTTIGTTKVTGTFTSDMVDEVVVPAGTFKNIYMCTADCESGGVKLTIKSFFAKDIGMIKQVIKSADQEVTVELEKFEPGK